MRSEIRPIPLSFPRFLHSGFHERRERGSVLLPPGAEIGLGLFSKATNLANDAAGPIARQRNNAAAPPLPPPDMR